MSFCKIFSNVFKNILDIHNHELGGVGFISKVLIFASNCDCSNASIFQDRRFLIIFFFQII